jgi:hypothetical protein
MSSGAHEWAQSLSGSERKAVEYYQSSEYRPINAALRDGDTKALRPYADVTKPLDAALNRATLGRDVTVYRYAKAGGGDALLNAPVGSIVHEPGYLSTSIDPAHVAKWAGYAKEEGEPVAIAEIHVPQGTHAAYLGEHVLSTLGQEQELLIQRGARMIVKSKHIDDAGIPHVRLELQHAAA